MAATLTGMPATMLAVSTTAILDACAARGLDPAEVLAQAGARDFGRDPDARIRPARAAAIWRAALAHSGDPAVVLHAAERPRFGAYRVLDYLAAAAPSLGDAFAHVAAQFAFVNPSIGVALRADARGVWLELSARTPVVPAYMEYALAAFYLRTRAATTLPFAATAVELGSPAPRDRDEYVRVFGCAPRFDRPRWALHVPRDAWHAPNPRRDADLLAILVDYASRLAPAPANLVDEVRDAIRDQLAAGTPTLAETARRLATSTRSLQRRLAREGVRFHDALEAARIDEARVHLLDPRLSVSEVARRVGYAQMSSFTRAFGRWMKQSPRAFRRNRS
jgi:AraC-like DNA-binding protein